MRVARLLLLLALAAAGPLAAETGRSVAGTDRARVLPPAGAVVEPYRNAGYELRFAEGGVEVSVDLAPLASPEPFSAPAVAPRGQVAVLARRAAAGASTRYEAVTRVLSWIREHVRYELDRDQPQDPEAVLERGSAYCTGIARLAVAMLAEIGVEAREVPGYVLEELPGGPRVGFHRWIEVRYGLGWVFSDPLATLHYVPASYVQLAAERLEELPGWGQLLERDDRVEEIDLAPHAFAGLRVRRNDERRSAAALVVRLDGATTGEATLDGEDGRRVVRLQAGSGRFLGLEPGRYRLRVETAGGVAARKDLIFRAPVLAELTIPVDPPVLAGGGGRGGRTRR